MDVARSSRLSQRLALRRAAWWAMRRSLPRIDGELAAAGLAAAASHRARCARHARHHRRLARRSRLRHRFRARAGPLLPDGSVAAARRRASCRSCSAPWRSSRTRARGASAFAPSRAAWSRARPPSERAVIEAYARGVNAGLAEPRRASLGIPGAARAAARLDRRRIRCWSCTRCGGSCSTAPSTARDRPAAPRARRGRERRRRRRARARSASSMPAIPTGTRLTIRPSALRAGRLHGIGARAGARLARRC